MGCSLCSACAIKNIPPKNPTPNPNHHKRHRTKQLRYTAYFKVLPSEEKEDLSSVMVERREATAATSLARTAQGGGQSPTES